MNPTQLKAFWSLEPETLYVHIDSRPSGLTSEEAAKRDEGRPAAKSEGPNPWRSLLLQFANPIQLLLVGAAILSGSLGQYSDAAVILFILIAGALLSFQHEYRAGNAVAALMKLVETQSRVVRQSAELEIPLATVVPGDIVLLSAGSIIPGDGVVLESESLYVDQSALTGESFPSDKVPGVTEASATIEKRTNAIYAGSHVVSGTGRALILYTGPETQLGTIAASLKSKRPEGDFEHGIHSLGMLLIQLTVLLTLLVFALNVFLHRPVLESFMFSLALAVGLTPQLLPAIVSVNLSRGAVAMAKDNVIVKRLASIENFGSMEILCSDKTGTITTGEIEIAGAKDASGNPSDHVLELARLNAFFESGYANPIDAALRKCSPADLDGHREKLSELPYDFTRKRLSVLIKEGDQLQIITKGALEPVVNCCAQLRIGELVQASHEEVAKVLALFKGYSEQGYRVLGVASKSVQDPDEPLTAAMESSMVFEGFLLLEDPLRPESAATVKKLASIGIAFKMITGDNRHVAKRIGSELGLTTEVLTGSEISKLSDAALHVRVASHSMYAEIEPNQKQRIIMALKRRGAVVGYIGDGINDGAALHAADVGISVANAVDVAKEAADFVMLKPDLGVLVGAVNEGRKTFTNTMKYIFMATSANFGNMFSLAGATIVVPFLPLLAKQVMLTNLLTDMPETTIASDNVDPEVLLRPQKWDMRYLIEFMLLFGFLSSFFDFSTFGVLIWLKATPEVFRTAWFTESVISASLVVLVFRSRRWLGQSRPSTPLMATTFATAAIVLALPFVPYSSVIGFTQLPFPIIGLMLLIVALYVGSAELAKHWFFNVRQKKHA